jgi:2-methylcitrate dehydratase PrpD
MGASLTTRIADYVVSVLPHELPATVQQEATRSLFNIIGCMLGGARHDGVDKIVAALSPCFGQPTATLVGRSVRADMLHATMINCLASSIYSFDDTHEQAVVHPSGPVAAALLALAELHNVSGQALLAAFAIGIELECRLCKALTVAPAKGSLAWSGTGISAGAGAAAAASRLLGLDVERTAHAIGIALSQAAGFRALHGSLCTPLMPSHAAQCGLRAALMASAGVTASQEALEGKLGYLSVFAEEADLDALVGGLGERFELTRNTYKPYPCGIVIHPIIDACLALRREHRLASDQIHRVLVKASPGAMALCNNAHPQNEMQAHVSLHHWTAVAFIRGTASIVDMDTQSAVMDPDLMAFRHRVEAFLDPELAADAALVTVILQDGTSIDCRIEHGIGSASRPMTNAELEEKFANMAVPVLGEARSRVLMDRCWGVQTLPDAAVLAQFGT